jgi:hypothetical protein
MQIIIFVNNCRFINDVKDFVNHTLDTFRTVKSALAGVCQDVKDICIYYARILSILLIFIFLSRNIYRKVLDILTVWAKARSIKGFFVKGMVDKVLDIVDKVKKDKK